MPKYKTLTVDELEKIIDEYNLLVIKEEDLYKSYMEAERMSRMSIAIKLRHVAAKLLMLQSTIDRNSKKQTIKA